MGWIKRTFQILAGLCLIVNLSISFGYNQSFKTAHKSVHTELLASKNDVTGQVLRYDIAQQFLLFNSKKYAVDKFEWNRRVQITNSKNLSSFKVQKHTSLELKPLLLEIVLRDIVPRSSLI